MIYSEGKVVPWTNPLTNKTMYSAALKFTRSRKWIHANAENGMEDRITLFETEKGAHAYLDRAIENLVKRGMWEG